MKWANSLDELIENWEGIGKNLSGKDVDPEQLQLGIEIELEHTNDKDLAEKIALDHLYEDSQYYTKLQKMEKGLCD
jgi:hypothetical protein